MGASEFVPYSHRQLGLTFMHPVGWVKDFSRGALFIYPTDAERVSASGKVIMSPCITLMVGEIPKVEKSPLEYCKEFVSEQSKRHTKFKLLWEHEVELSSGEEALEWSYEFFWESYPFSAVSIKSLRKMSPDSGIDYKFYLLEGSCLRSQFKNLESTLLTVNRSLSLQ